MEFPGVVTEREARERQQTAKVSVRTCETTVVLEREEGTLGITLRGGILAQPVVITHVKPEGPAAKEGTIKPGDRLIAVNGVSLKGRTLAEAETLLKQSAKVMSLTIEYDVEKVDRTNGPLKVTITRTKDEDLGLTLHQNEEGVFIENVKRGSVSERCGALHSGDEILAVNNCRIDIGPQKMEHFVKLLEENSAALNLEILPYKTSAKSSSRTWRIAESQEYIGWYGSTAVTHIEKLHTSLVRDHSGFGLRFGNLPSGAIIITQVLPKSPAERCGCLCPGDRVIAINHQSVALDTLTADDANILLESSHSGRLTLHIEFDVLDTVVPSSGVFNVRLVKRGSSGMGLTIAALKEDDFVVCDIKKGSPAYRAGSVMPGDRLLTVNGIPLDSSTADHIGHLLQLEDEVITLKLERSPHPPDFSCNRKVTCTVELQRYGGPLGITIAGSEEPNQPITVSSLTPGGLAELTGALLVGDEILAINNQSLYGEPLSTAQTLLQNSPNLVSLKVSRAISTQGRNAVSVSPLQQSSVDSAVDSWGSSHLDLTPSPDQIYALNKKPSPEGDLIVHQDNIPKQCYDHLKLLDEITNDNLNIRRELDILSQQIHQQSLNQPLQQWENIPPDENYVTNAAHTTLHNLSNLPNELGMNSHKTPNGAGDSDTHSDIQNIEMSHFSENRQLQLLSTSQPSIRSEFRTHSLFKVELKKDPVYEDFGFSVSDGLYERGVFINRIRRGGPADLCQCLYPYDRILQVNGTCTQDFDCCLTVPLIATSGENLTLLVARAPNADTAYELNNEYLMTDSLRVQPKSSQLENTYKTIKRIMV